MHRSMKEEIQRFVAGVIAGTVAITFILPFGGMRHAPHHSSDVNFISLLPAAAAWLAFMSDNSRLAGVRTVMLTIAFVGAGALGLRSTHQVTSPAMREIMESAQFVPQSIVYIGIGLLGLIGSLLVANNEVSGS